MTRLGPEGAFGIGQPPNQGITRTGPRSVEVQVPPFSINPAVVDRAEALALETANTRRNTLGTYITWAAVVPKIPTTVEAGQPVDTVERQTWRPGQPLPPRTLYTTVTITVTT